MLHGSGHEPHYLPELDGSYASLESPSKLTVVWVAAAGSAVTTFLLLWAWSVGATLLGPPRTRTPEEIMQRSQLLWIALAVFVVTMVATFGIARGIDISWARRVGLALVGVVAGVAFLVIALLGFVSVFS